MGQKLITILGPTAAGKTALAVALAKKIGGEIISADSRQVYRGMDIGTGKDLEEYGCVPCHLVNICAVGEKYNLFRYKEDFQRALADIRKRNVYPILCGGTGLYIEAVLKGYNLRRVPRNVALRDSLAGKSLEELTGILVEMKRKNGTKMHNHTDVVTVRRAVRAVEIESGSAGERYENDEGNPENDYEERRKLVFGISISREARRERITRRLKHRLENGMIEEVKHLLDSGIKADDLIYYGLEYKYVTEYCIGKCSYEDMFISLETAIHQFAKRQMTWFRGMERRGINIHWIDCGLSEDEQTGNIMSFL